MVVALDTRSERRCGNGGWQTRRVLQVDVILVAVYRVAGTISIRTLVNKDHA